MEYCPHCMLPTEGAVCTHCGREVSWSNSPDLLPVGSILRGSRPYQIGAILGRGGFGVTYIAMDLSNGRRVAVKEYFPAQIALRTSGGHLMPATGCDQTYEKGMASFLQEAKMLSSLQGMPSVVQGLEYMQSGGTAYLVMEYLDGEPLYRIVDRQKRIPAQELLPRLKPLMADIGKLHAQGVVHRDISPDNILWMSDGTLKLLDFGSARSTLENRTMSMFIKKGFSPPEQYHTRVQGPATDVYALAATVYYCLTGTLPPDAPGRLLSNETLKSPNSLGAGLTTAQEKALLWGMELDKERRPADMAAFSSRMFPESALRRQPEKPPVTPPGWQAAQTRSSWQAISEGLATLPWNTLALCACAAAAALVLTVLAAVVLFA